MRREGGRWRWRVFAAQNESRGGSAGGLLRKVGSSWAERREGEGRGSERGRWRSEWASWLRASRARGREKGRDKVLRLT